MGSYVWDEFLHMKWVLTYEMRSNMWDSCLQILKLTMIHCRFRTCVHLMGWVLQHGMSSSMWDEFLDTSYMSQISIKCNQKVLLEHNNCILKRVLNSVDMLKSSRKIFYFGGGFSQKKHGSNLYESINPSGCKIFS